MVEINIVKENKMKKLILILLIAFGMGVTAQDTIIPKMYITIGIDTFYLIADGDIIDNNKFTPLPQIFYEEYITIKDIFEYEAECFNDSMKYLRLLGEEKIDTLIDNLGGYTIMRYIEPKYLYKHKEPTFKGFIKWLKNNK